MLLKQIFSRASRADAVRLGSGSGFVHYSINSLTIPDARAKLEIFALQLAGSAVWLEVARMGIL